MRQRLNVLMPRFGDTLVQGALAESVVANFFWQNVPDETAVEVADTAADLVEKTDLVVRLSADNRWTKQAEVVRVQVKSLTSSRATHPDRQMFFPLSGASSKELQALRTELQFLLVGAQLDTEAQRQLDAEVDHELANLHRYGNFGHEELAMRPPFQRMAEALFSAEQLALAARHERERGGRRQNTAALFVLLAQPMSASDGSPVPEAIFDIRTGEVTDKGWQMLRQNGEKELPQLRLPELKY